MLSSLVASSNFNSEISGLCQEFAATDIGFDSFTFSVVGVPGLDSELTCEDITKKVIEETNDLYKELNNDHVISDFVNNMNKQRMYCRSYFRKLDNIFTRNCENCSAISVVVGICTPRFALFVTRGNTKCIVFDIRGTSLDIIDVANPEGGPVSGDSMDVWDYAVVDTNKSPVIGVFGCSSGLNKSFARMDQEIHFLRDTIIFACKNNTHILSSYLSKSFINMSKRVDMDVSLAGFLDVERMTPFVSTFSRMNKNTGVKVELDQVSKRLDELKDVDVDALEKRLETAKENYQLAFDEYEEAQEVFDEVFERTGKQAFFSMLASKLGNDEIVDEETAEKNLQKAELKMNKLLQEYEVAKTEYDEHLAKVDSLTRQKSKLGRKMRLNNY